MIELLIVRHGQSVADIEERMEGRADFPLTDLGHSQAERAADWICNNYRPDIILSSPLKRASQTAQYISKKVGIEISYCDDLVEKDNGLLAGLLRTEADIKYPLPNGGLKSYDPSGITGESLYQVRTRAEAFFSRLLNGHYIDLESINRICIVSHGCFISMLFRSFLNLSLENDTWILTGDTGIHLWKIDGSLRQIVFANGQEHLNDTTDKL